MWSLTDGRGSVKDNRDGTFDVSCNWYAWATVAPGVVDEAARVAFSRGHCHAMALALHEATGWAVSAAMFDWDRDDPPIDDLFDVPGHFAVTSPDGRIVDIFGEYDPAHDPAGFGKILWLPSSPERIDELVFEGDYRPLDALDLARSMVPALIAAPDPHTLELS